MVTVFDQIVRNIRFLTLNDIRKSRRGLISGGALEAEVVTFLSKCSCAVKGGCKVLMALSSVLQ